MSKKTKTKKPGEVNTWLLKQDKYTMHRPVRKPFPRNPYNVTNVIPFWQCDLVDVQSFAEHNDNYKYLLFVIDIFSKYLLVIPLKAKTGTAVASAFMSIFSDSRYSKPVRRRPNWVRTDRGKEFLNRSFQDALKEEGIQFQVCWDPNVKCSIIGRSHLMLRDKMYKHFTYENTYRYIDVLPKFVRAYNDTVHTTTDMAPSHVGDSDILKIWNRMRARQSGIKHTIAKFRVFQHVRISIEKLRFAKGGEQNYTTEIFKITKVMHRSPRPVYELGDLHGQPIEGHFYAEELSPVIIAKAPRRKEIKY